MRRRSLILLMLAFAAPLAAGELEQELATVRELLRQLDQAESRAAAGSETLKAAVKAAAPLSLGRGSTPAVAYGHLGGTFQDQGSTGLAQRRASAASLGAYLRLEGGLAGGATYYLVMDVRHDPDEEDIILPIAPSLAPVSGNAKVVFHRLRLGAQGRGFDVQAGYLEVKNSTLTYTGGDGGRPNLFERDRYAENQTAQSGYEYLFQTGAGSRYEPVKYPWGLRGTFSLLEKGELYLFVTNLDTYYDAPAHTLRDSGGRLKWSLGAGEGDHIGLAGYNRSNDTGEILSAGGLPGDPINGLQNASVLSGLFQQSLGGFKAKGEAAYAWSDHGAAGRHVQGSGVDVELSRDWGGWESALFVQAMQAGFIPGSDKGLQAGVNGFELQQAANGDDYHATVLAEPGKPMLNATLLGAKLALRPGFGTLSFSMKAGPQASPSSAVLRTAHALGGNNAAGAAWWTLLGGNYSPWAPPAAPASPPLATNSRTRAQDLYNRSSYTGAALSDASGTLAYGAQPYRHLDTSGWRDNFERIILADPATGRPLDPAQRHLAYASADWRLNLGEAAGLDHGLYLVLFQDLLSVSDQAQAAPSLEGGYFHQAVGQATAILQAGDGLYLLLNAGLETWRSGYQPQRIVPYTPALAPHPGRLEYHDRQFGVGVDWDAIPNQLALYGRFKILDHHDSAFEGNDFQSRQLWLEAKSFF